MSDVAKTPREELECEKKYLYEYSMFWECKDGFKSQILEDDVVALLNELHSIIRRDEISIQTMMSNMKKLEEENEQLRKENFFLAYWKRKAMTLLMQVRRLTPRMTDKEVTEFSKELEDE